MSEKKLDLDEMTLFITEENNKRITIKQHNELIGEWLKILESAAAEISIEIEQEERFRNIEDAVGEESRCDIMCELESASEQIEDAIRSLQRSVIQR